MSALESQNTTTLPATARKQRVLIVDDHELVRTGLRTMIATEPGLEVCGEADNEAGAWAIIQAEAPDIAIIDIAIKDGNGLDLVKRIRSANEATRMIVASMYPERLYGERALRAGAHAYVSKQDSAAAILVAIRRVLEGKTHFGDELIDRLLQRPGAARQPSQISPVESLSDRELDVFRLIGQGRTTSEIASRLHVSRSTIETYRDRLKTKLSLSTGAELIQQATLWTLRTE